jgi:hypothetical protein
MAALTLLIIRHAEKPGEDWPGPGLTSDGAPDEESLVVRGWQRAGAWATLFGTRRGGIDYPPPTKVYAANPDAPPGEGVSKRPYQTALPLANRLFGQPPNTTSSKGEEKKLVKELLGLYGVVLVSWEHRAIVEDILPQFTISKGTAPTHWNASRYDVVLRLDRAEGTNDFAFQQLFPQLLSGDSDMPLG